MSLLLQISDPHFGAEQPPVVGGPPTNGSAGSGPLVVLSGDITQRAPPDPVPGRARLRGPPGGAGSGRAGQPRHPALRPLGAADAAPYGGYGAAFGTDTRAVRRHSPNSCWPACIRRAPGDTRMARYGRRRSTVSPRWLAACRVRRSCAWSWCTSLVAVTRPEDRPNRLRGHAGRPAGLVDAGADLVGRSHPPPLRPAAARPGAATVGRPGRHRRFVPRA